jgi:hypothetical protein
MSREGFKPLRTSDHSLEESLLNTKSNMVYDLSTNSIIKSTINYPHSIFKQEFLPISTNETGPNAQTLHEGGSGRPQEQLVVPFFDSVPPKVVFDEDTDLSGRAYHKRSLITPAYAIRTGNLDQVDFNSDSENFYQVPKSMGTRKAASPDLPIQFKAPRPALSNGRPTQEWVFGLPSFLEKLGARVRSKRQYPCVFCGKIFPAPAALGGHQSKHHPGQKKADYVSKKIAKTSKSS